jgi:hypothetical protein
MSEVSRNKPTHCVASAGATPEYTARCQSSEGPEITRGPEYGSARSCVLCTVIRRSNRSGAFGVPWHRRDRYWSCDGVPEIGSDQGPEFRSSAA